MVPARVSWLTGDVQLRHSAWRPDADVGVQKVKGPGPGGHAAVLFAGAGGFAVEHLRQLPSQTGPCTNEGQTIMQCS